MHSTDVLIDILKKLRLSSITTSLDIRIEQAASENISYTDFLVRVLSDEIERRNGKRLEMRLQKARFDPPGTIEDFDFTFNSMIPKARILELATCTFVTRKENIYIAGATGIGKSHIAAAIGHRACLAGHNVLFASASTILQSLREGRADASYKKKLLAYTSPDLLIIDDLGLKSLSSDEPSDFYEIISKRYERGSTIITSNRAINELAELFPDLLLANAAIDRFLHHAHIIEIEDADSYRNPRSRPKSMKMRSPKLTR
jgi:DNA replication protein DnaC